MAHDDVAAERARLEAVAWGAGSSPADAARARIALQDLERRRRSRVRPVRPVRDPRPGGTASVGTPDPSSTRSRPGRGSTPARPASRSGNAPASAAAQDHESVSAGALMSDGATARAAAGVSGATDGGGGDRVDGRSADGGGAPGLQAVLTGRSRWRRWLWTERPRAWIAGGAAAAVGVAFAAGTLVGTAQPDVAAAPSITPTAGTVTLEQLLDVPQTYADQLPGPVEAPVNLRTTRLVFTNRALDGGTLNTPWNVWAGVGTDRSTICLIATADRIESSTACFPRQAALHGSVSMSAQSTSGTLTITLRGGGVQGRVTNEY
ncbi:hypothetical protein [Curtobacterium sp. VKM Ac-1376]|uniref:hypothetical protein n=1 Tax=Curtobacterium sp. VKM Ac-1376 TaxID=123312 RepID=UPI00188B80F2|nr:hypothetical protein [Curtobacterium sp. VKM Ac-1376]MBF4614954.1 hypothetical protein [Curtobacterium sp. VKM Ac-1376]